MTDVGLGELIVRMVVSLAIVLAIVLGAYAILRRRPGMGSGGGSSRRPTARSSRGATRGSTGGNRGTTNKRGLRIVARVGVSRTSSVVAVQFAERVLLVGASDHTVPAVIAELSLEDWEAATELPEASIPLSVGTPSSAAAASPRPSLIESLREATTRRG